MSTPADIRSKLCGRCGYDHAGECVTCDHPTLFIDPDSGLCVQCHQFPGQTSIYTHITE